MCGGTTWEGRDKAEIRDQGSGIREQPVAGRFVVSHPFAKYAKGWGTRLYSDKNEFGFCLRKSNGTLLFVGYWLQFWNDGHPYPICFGIPDAAPKVQEAFKNAFQEAYKEEAVSFVDKWTMGWVPEGDFNSLDAVDEIWRKLAPIWKKVSEASD
jgi:hypothetical protein